MPPSENNNDDIRHSTTTMWPFIFLFVASMIGHELALESLSTTYMFFPHLATSITLFQFGFCVLLPLMVSHACVGGDVTQSFPRSFKEIWIYTKLSAIVYGATAFATMSLNYEGVTYVTKVVFKSSKLIPTMIVGVVMDARAERSGINAKKRKYSLREYASAVLLCVGAAGFCMPPRDSGAEENDARTMQEDTHEHSDGRTNGGHWVGISLLAISVFCDAIVPNLQHQLMHGIGDDPSDPRRRKVDDDDDDDDDEVELKSLMAKEPAKNNETPTRQHHVTRTGLTSQALMVNTNSIGFSFLLLSTILRLTFLPIISFTLANPQFLLLHLTVGLGLGTAVLSYTELIKRSGPAVAVAVATRKCIVFLSWMRKSSSQHKQSCIFIDKTSSESSHRHLILHHFSKTDVWSSRNLLGDSRDGVDGCVRWPRETVTFAVVIIIHVSFLVYPVCLAASFPSSRQLQLHLRFHIFVLDSILCSLQTEISFVN